jgi:hypothetical protein
VSETVTRDEETTMSNGMLRDYKTGEAIREATDEEAAESSEAAERDGGAGVILVDDRRCYVEATADKEAR